MYVRIRLVQKQGEWRILNSDKLHQVPMTTLNLNPEFFFSKLRPKIRLKFPKVSVHTPAIPIVELHTLLHNQKCQFRPFLVELRLFFTSMTHLKIGFYIYIVDFYQKIPTFLLNKVFQIRSIAYGYYIQYILKL